MEILGLLFLLVFKNIKAHIDTFSLTCDYMTFACGNRQCIPWYFRCDGETDCFDNSDEVNCGQHSTAWPVSRCNKHTEFTCVNGGCVVHSVMCNGYNDCGDNSDEQYCHFQSRTTPHISVGSCNIQSEYTCANRKCVNSHYVCNGINDCGDNSDELYCNHVRPITSTATTHQRPFGWFTVLGKKKRNKY